MLGFLRSAIERHLAPDASSERSAPQSQAVTGPAAESASPQAEPPGRFPVAPTVQLMAEPMIARQLEFDTSGFIQMMIVVGHAIAEQLE